jgi:heme O synthase-like polyprenyltransferase
VARKILIYSYVMVVVTLALAPYAGWVYTACAVALGGWFLAEAHRLHARVAAMPDARRNLAPVPAPVPAPPAPAGAGGSAVATAVEVTAPVEVVVAAAAPADSGVTEGACAGVVQPSANPAPMRLFHLSIAYLTLLFAVIAVTAVLPWGGW